MNTTTLDAREALRQAGIPFREVGFWLVIDEPGKPAVIYYPYRHIWLVDDRWYWHGGLTGFLAWYAWA